MDTIVTLLILFILFSVNTFAQDYTQWALPEGTKMRLGKGRIYEIQYSPDEARLAVASSIGIWLYDTATLREVALLTGHTGSVESVTFSPDGGTLASRGDDGTILLWALTPAPDVNATVRVSPSPVPSPAIGAQLTPSLKISGGENVAGYQVTVGFDTSAIRYVDSANGDYLPPGAFLATPVVEGITLAATLLAGDGTLATLTFEVIAVKALTVSISEVMPSDSAGAGFRPQIENGEVVEPTQVTGDVNGVRRGRY